MKIGKPLAVLSKATAGEVDGEQPPPEPVTAAEAQEGVAYNILGIIRQKIIFKNRPKPICRTLTEQNNG